MGETYEYPMLPQSQEDEQQASPEDQQYQEAKDLLRSVLIVPEKRQQTDQQDDMPWAMSAYDYLLTDYPRYASDRSIAKHSQIVPALIESLKQKLSPVVSAARLAGRSIAGIGGLVARPLMADPMFSLLGPGEVASKMDDFSREGLIPKTVDWSKP